MRITTSWGTPAGRLWMFLDHGLHAGAGTATTASVWSTYFDDSGSGTSLALGLAETVTLTSKVDYAIVGLPYGAADFADLRAFLAGARVAVELCFRPNSDMAEFRGSFDHRIQGELQRLDKVLRREVASTASDELEVGELRDRIQGLLDELAEDGAIDPEIVVTVRTHLVEIIRAIDLVAVYGREGIVVAVDAAIGNLHRLPSRQGNKATFSILQKFVLTLELAAAVLSIGSSALSVTQDAQPRPEIPAVIVQVTDDDVQVTTPDVEVIVQRNEDLSSSG